jgi:hypothetical protein
MPSYVSAPLHSGTNENTSGCRKQVGYVPRLEEHPSGLPYALVRSRWAQLLDSFVDKDPLRVPNRISLEGERPGQSACWGVEPPVGNEPTACSLRVGKSRLRMTVIFSDLPAFSQVIGLVGRQGSAVSGTVPWSSGTHKLLTRQCS